MLTYVRDTYVIIYYLCMCAVSMSMQVRTYILIPYIFTHSRYLPCAVTVANNAAMKTRQNSHCGILNCADFPTLNNRILSDFYLRLIVFVCFFVCCSRLCLLLFSLFKSVFLCMCMCEFFCLYNYFRLTII